MPQAVWNGEVIADSDDTVVVDGNHYFPPEAVNWEYLAASDDRSVCPWKGVAGYYDVVVDGSVARAAAWHYATPNDAAAHIKDHIAFWRGVTVDGGGRLRSFFGR